jgi:hypothetical protein
MSTEHVQFNFLHCPAGQDCGTERGLGGPGTHNGIPIARIRNESFGVTFRSAFAVTRRVAA